MRRKVHGITVVEVVVAITIATIVAIGLLPLLLHTLLGNTKASVESSLQHRANAALSTVSATIARSQKILTTPDYSDTAAPATSGWTGSNSILILRQAATDRAPQNSSREPIYTGTGGTNDCTSERTPVFVNVVYYVHDKTLYQRTLAPTLSGTCGDIPIFQKTSCLTCSDKPKDTAITNDVAAFTIAYRPEETGVEDKYKTTDLVRLSLALENDSYSHTSYLAARLLLSSKSIGSD